MALFNFTKKQNQTDVLNQNLESFLADYSIEVMPRTAQKVGDFWAILPQKTRVYIAHIEGTPIEDMVATAAQFAKGEFSAMPHFPARIIKDKAMLENWIAQHQGEAGINQALLLAGDVTTPLGDYDSSMQLLETELFYKAGFKHMHVAGHPEDNKNIDPDGSMKNIEATLQ